MNSLIMARNLLFYGTLYMVSYIQPFLWFPSYVFRGVVVLIASFIPNLGNVLNPISTLLADESYTKYPPKNSLIGTITVDGDVSLKEFRDLFKQTVLEGKITTNSFWKQPIINHQNRYPEFQQYQTNFLGFQFWKDDPDFHIDNHIVERVLLPNESPSLSSIHQEMHNKLFCAKRSPWEIILIRNYKSLDEVGSLKTVIAARFHHSMADAKSILKVFVEGLGQRPLSLATPQVATSQGILFYLTFPFYYFCVTILGSLYKAYQSSLHPWRVNMFGGNPRLQVVGMSPKLSLHDIKRVAKMNKVATSAVIISLMAGAIGKMDNKLRKKWVIAGYILPKTNHPPKLINHMHIGALVLPTNENSALLRLQACQKNFADLKESQLEKYFEFVHLQAGTLYNPLRKMTMRNIFFPIGVTNIAGENQGFSIGQHTCSEFVFSLGKLTGCAGVIFSSSSYKDHLRIAVAADESVMNETQTQKLAEAMWNELEILKSLRNQ